MADGYPLPEPESTGGFFLLKVVVPSILTKCLLMRDCLTVGVFSRILWSLLYSIKMTLAVIWRYVKKPDVYSTEAQCVFRLKYNRVIQQHTLHRYTAVW